MSFQGLRIVLILLTIILSGVSSVALADLQEDRAKKIEAAFLLQFCKYVTWPDAAFPEADAPIIVGILGRDPFGSVIDDLARLAKVNGRTIEIRRYTDFSAISSCHLLFISQSMSSQVQKISETVEGLPILLVTDSKDFSHFSIINFVTVNKKIRFNIRQENYQKAGLKISSKLLQVANMIL